MISKTLKRYFLGIALIFSFLLNLFFYFVEIHPIILKKIHKDKYLTSSDANNHKSLIVKAALQMNLSQNTKMKFGTPDNFFQEVRKLRNSNQEKIFEEYNYLKAFLLNGLIEYGIKRKDNVILNRIPDIFRNYINAKGEILFEMNKVDQATFGLAFIETEQYTHHPEYKKGIDLIYKYLKDSINKKHNIIIYRNKDLHQFVDALGMVCPFLIKYGVTYHDTLALGIANREINYYIKYGLEANTHFPFHAIELDNKIRLGPSTWGRGIGWYAIALAYSIHYTNKHNNPYYKVFENEMNIIYNNLNKLRYNNCWGQFINGDENEQVDTSTTALLLLAFNIAGKESLTDEAIAHIFRKYTTTEGYIDFTSGDTFDINRYSTEFGKSELTQGLILSLYSNAKNE